MGFEMIGVQFDQAGHDQVAGRILGARRRIAVAKVRDAAIAKRDPAAFDHAIGQNDPSVAHYRLFSCRTHLDRLPSHATAANDVTSTIRSAISWRISSS